MSGRLWRFEGAANGQFEITSLQAIRGNGLPPADRLRVSQAGRGSAASSAPGSVAFSLRGVVSNERYVTRAEKTALSGVQRPIGEAASTLGALIPIKKCDAWWALAQDERREIFEQRSAHVVLGLRALPGVVRRLHHCRDLGSDEPFDFLTWFDFAADDAQRFDDLLGALRATEEWQYVEREVELRVTRRDAAGPDARFLDHPPA